MSAALARASPAMIGPSTCREISRTASKSPGEAIGNPASITSTPRRASCCAISSFSSVLSEMPGDCSPSRSVVSKINTRLGSMSKPPSTCSKTDASSCSVAATRPPARYSPRRGRRRRRMSRLFDMPLQISKRRYVKPKRSALQAKRRSRLHLTVLTPRGATLEAKIDKH